MTFPGDGVLGLVRRVGLLCGSLVVALVLVETAARLRDGDSLFSPKLRSKEPTLPSQRQVSSGGAPPALLDYVAKIPITSGIDRAWFQVDPPEVPRRPVDPALQARFDEFERRGVPPPQSYYIWNTELVKAACRSKEDVFRNFPPDVKEFSTVDHSPYPAYRLPPNQTLPSGLVTNQFGFRGPALASRKDAKLIRVAFIGASTTQGVQSHRWSYPELAGSWLNMWLRHQHRPERVEIINAGREGLNSPDIREIVKHELVPLQPDYVVYLEGAALMRPPPVKWPGGRVPSMPGGAKGTTRRGLPRWLLEYSAFARTLDPVAVRVSAPSSDEPPKPKYDLKLPSPDRVTLAELSAVFGTFLQTITRDLDEDSRTVKDIDARLVVSSVIQLVHAGLRLDPVAHAITYQQLNTLFQPLTYADIRRLVDLQNAAYRMYSTDRGVDFLDVATEFPQDPALFLDSFHLNERGVRLHAWLVFLGLKAILERDLGRLTRPAPKRAPPPEPPASFDARLPPCSPPPAAARVSTPIALSSVIVKGTPSHVVEGRVMVDTDPQSWAYAATLAVPPPTDRQSPSWIEATVKVSRGVIGLGLLNSGQSEFLAQRAVAQADGLATLSFRIEPGEDSLSLVLFTGSEPVSARAEIDAVTLVQQRP